MKTLNQSTVKQSTVKQPLDYVDRTNHSRANPKYSYNHSLGIRTERTEDNEASTAVVVIKLVVAVSLVSLAVTLASSLYLITLNYVNTLLTGT